MAYADMISESLRIDNEWNRRLNMANYTKGEWKAAGYLIFSGETPPRLIATVGTVNLAQHQWVANAQLIAASPRMIEFIKKLADSGNQEAKDFIQRGNQQGSGQSGG